MGVRIDLPPLRERVEDIPELARHILSRLGSAKSFSKAALGRMQSYAWPGNIRQFARVVEAVDALCDAEEVGPADLPPPLGGAVEAAEGGGNGFALLSQVVAEAERDHIRRALALAEGNKERAREMLGISKDTFWKRLKTYGL